MVDVVGLAGMAIGGILGGLILNAILNSVKRTARRKEGWLILEYAAGIRYLPLAVIVFFLTLSILITLAVGAPKANEVPLLVAFLLVPSVPSSVVAVETLGRSIRASESAIVVRSPWSGRHQYVWEEVEHVSFNKGWQRYDLHTAKGVIRISSALNGVPELLSLMERRVPSERRRGLSLG